MNYLALIAVGLTAVNKCYRSIRTKRMRAITSVIVWCVAFVCVAAIVIVALTPQEPMWEWGMLLTFMVGLTAFLIWAAYKLTCVLYDGSSDSKRD